MQEQAGAVQDCPTDKDIAGREDVEMGEITLTVVLHLLTHDWEVFVNVSRASGRKSYFSSPAMR